MGLPTVDSAALAAQWHLQPKQASFITMTQALLTELALPGGLPLELVMFCHWSSDCEIGHSISNFIVEHCQAKQAFAFAISESGPVAPFLAYDLIRRWSLNQGHALVITADQSSHMHHSHSLSDHQTDNVGSAMLWSKSEPAGLCSGYHSITQADLLANCTWYDSVQAVCPFDLHSAHILTDTRSQACWMPRSQATVFEDNAPCAWPFHLAKPWLATLAQNKPSVSGLVLCRTYRDTTHLLWFYPENQDENY
ncbi:hypothetical protein BCU43_025650 (plasmid) [Vibrio lentus]